jgi:hypothetical protein
LVDQPVFSRYTDYAILDPNNKRVLSINIKNGEQSFTRRINDDVNLIIEVKLAFLKPGLSTINDVDMKTKYVLREIFCF